MNEDVKLEDGNPVKVIRPYQQAQTDEELDRARRDKIGKWLTEKRRQFNLCKDARTLQDKRSIEETKFNSGIHWDDDARKQREDKQMVIIEINRTPQFLNQVANEQRMTRPSAVIKPVGNGADEETAQVKQGLFRSIDIQSDAETIRDDAFYRMLEKGWSHWQLVIEYENERSMRQVIRVKEIANDFAVYTDPAMTKFDGSDADFRFITDDMPLSNYKAEYPKSKLASLDSFTSLGDVPKDWIGDGIIRVCAVWEKTRDREKLYALADDPMGDGKYEDELNKGDDGKLIGVAYVGDEPMYRWSMRTRVKWAKFNAVEILEGNEDLTDGREPVPGSQYIPIISLYGRRVMIEDKMIWTGMVRDAIEPCLALDYWLSAATEMVALGTKAPWVVAYESIAQYKEMWDTANLENYAALFYDKTGPDGTEYPAPFKNFGEAPIQGMAFILNFAQDDLKRVMGIYNAALGAPGPEDAGVAIKARQQESDVANFNYIDNLKRSIKYETKVKLEWSKYVYDSKQVLQIVRPEANSAEAVTINAEFKDPKTNKLTTYDMVNGDYDVEVEIGPTVGDRREQAAQGILNYLKIDPASAPFVGDLLARNLDFPDKNELEKRLKHRVPPGVIDQNDGTADIPQQFKAQYQQQSQALEQVTQAFQQLKGEMAGKQAQYDHEERMKAAELASQERIASANNDAKIAIQELAAKSQADKAMIDAALARVQQDMEDFKKPGPVEWMFDPTTNAITPTGSTAQAPQPPPAPAPSTQQPQMAGAAA